MITEAGLFSLVASMVAKDKNMLFDFAVVDEAQDISVAHIRFFAALGGGRPNALFFAGDLGQRIFQQPFSWKGLGVDVRGRSRTLRVNYRTSHQIRTQADRLLGPVVTDVDGNSEDRSDTVSVFNGPPPTILSLDSEGEEIETVGKWIAERANAGVLPHDLRGRHPGIQLALAPDVRERVLRQVRKLAATLPEAQRPAQAVEERRCARDRPDVAPDPLPEDRLLASR